jgi:hypothetical protein
VIRQASSQIVGPRSDPVDSPESEHGQGDNQDKKEEE